MRHTRAAFIFPALGLATVLAACGGGVSKGDFVAKADASCTTAAAPVSAVAKPTNLPELSTAAGTLATASDAQAAALRAVEPPGDDKAAVTGIASAIAEVAGPARALQDTAAKADDAATGRAANDVKAKLDGAAAQAGAYGLAQCAKNLQGPGTTIFEGARAVLKAAFVARAETLCQAATRKVEALPEPSSLTGVGRFLTSYLPIETKLFTDIRALPVPPGEEAAIADMLTTQDRVIENDKEMQAAAQRNNEELFDRLSEEDSTLVTAANAKFDAYGLRKCGTLSPF